LDLRHDKVRRIGADRSFASGLILNLFQIAGMGARFMGVPLPADEENRFPAFERVGDNYQFVGSGEEDRVG
jgi:hypothetical protein